MTAKGWEQIKVGGKYGTYQNGVFVPGTSKRTTNTKKRAPIAKNVRDKGLFGGVGSWTAGGTDPLGDVVRSSDKAGRINGVQEGRDQGDVYSQKFGANSFQRGMATPGSVSGRQKLLKTRSTSGGTSMAPSLMGTQTANQATADKAEKPNYFYNAATGQKDSTATSVGGVRSESARRSESATWARTELQNKFESKHGKQDISLTYFYDGEGNITGVDSFQGTTGDPSLDEVRFSKYKEQFESNGTMSDEALDQKYNQAESEAYANAIGGDDPFVANMGEHEKAYQSSLREEDANLLASQASAGEDKSQDDDDVAKYQAMVDISEERRDRQFKRAEDAKNAEIQRLTTAKKTAITARTKKLAGIEKSRLEMMASQGAFSTNAFGEAIGDSDAYMNAIKGEYVTQLDEYVAEQEELYNANVSKAENEYLDDTQKADDEHYDAMIEIQKMAMDDDEQKEAQRQKEEASATAFSRTKELAVFKDSLTDSNPDYNKIMKEYKAIIGDNPGNAIVYAQKVRDNAIASGMSDEQATALAESLYNGAMEEQKNARLIAEGKQSVIDQKTITNTRNEEQDKIKAEALKQKKADEESGLKDLSDGATEIIDKKITIGVINSILDKFDDDKNYDAGDIKKDFEISGLRSTRKELIEAKRFLEKKERESPINNYDGIFSDELKDSQGSLESLLGPQ